MLRLLAVLSALSASTWEDGRSQCVDLSALGRRADAARCLLGHVQQLTQSAQEQSAREQRERNYTAQLGSELARAGEQHLKLGLLPSAAAALRCAVRLALLQQQQEKQQQQQQQQQQHEDEEAPPCDLLMELGIVYELAQNHSAAADAFGRASALCGGVADLQAMEGLALVNDAIALANEAADREGQEDAAADAVSPAAALRREAEAAQWRRRQQRGLALLRRAYGAEGGDGEGGGEGGLGAPAPSSLARTNLMRVDPCVVADSGGAFARLLAQGALALPAGPAGWGPPDTAGGGGGGGGDAPWLQRLELPPSLRPPVPEAGGERAREAAAAAVVIANGLLPASVTAAVTATLARHRSVFDVATFAGSVDNKAAHMISVLKGSGFRTGAAEWVELCEGVRRRAAPTIAATMGAIGAGAASAVSTADVLAGRALRLRECFVRQYAPAQRRGLAVHADVAALTLNVLLSPRASFRTERGGAGPTLFGYGGASGLDFQRGHSAEVALEQGAALLHSGAMLHGAEELVEGERLVLVLFLGSRAEIEREYRRHGKVAPRKQPASDRLDSGSTKFRWPLWNQPQ